MTRSVEIPEEAYEAAADAVAAMLRSWPASASSPHHPDLSPRDAVRAFAITALEAAALPYLAPAGDANAYHYSTEEIAAKIADCVPHADMDGFTLSERLRIGKAVAPLFQKLLPPAVPQPVDREALHDAVGEVWPWDDSDEQARDLRNDIVDAVLALLAGEQEQVESPE